MLVPIYGNVKYLENIDYLKQYGNKVMLYTSGNEKPEFYRDLKAIATAHGFKIFIDKPNSQYDTGGRLRALNSTKRDTNVTNALKEVGTYLRFASMLIRPQICIFHAWLGNLRKKP